ncbi:hypothetical protein WOLCODRAFT_152687 [Wolfiporia cocos MD-104 SS10]|uniref:Uncharacterized protein n=1 Tax=Wolfiporia cocos (strain MD-104) TaxID=742152 RepID=A0A2H3JL96_WOLCO|nr:hypothetical protein WOLCODRAFT_152687 [Wolfiporia cocos MD-104 SS10]
MVAGSTTHGSDAIPSRFRQLENQEAAEKLASLEESLAEAQDTIGAERSARDAALQELQLAMCRTREVEALFEEREKGLQNELREERHLRQEAEAALEELSNRHQVVQSQLHEKLESIEAQVEAAVAERNDFESTAAQKADQMTRELEEIEASNDRLAGDVKRMDAAVTRAIKEKDDIQRKYDTAIAQLAMMHAVELENKDLQASLHKLKTSAASLKEAQKIVEKLTEQALGCQCRPISSAIPCAELTNVAGKENENTPGPSIKRFSGRRWNSVLFESKRRFGDIGKI